MQNVNVTGEEIKMFRENACITEDAMASIFNVSTITVKRWENGTSAPTGTAAMLLEDLIHNANNQEKKSQIAKTTQFVEGKDLQDIAKISHILELYNCSGYAMYLLLKSIWEPK